MDLLFLADRALPDAAGGGQTVAWELAKGLLAKGHRVTMLTPSKDGEARPREVCEGISLLRHAGRNPLAMIAGGKRAMREALAHDRPTLVHSHFAYAELGPRMALANDIPSVRSFYGPWDEEGWVEDTGGRPGPHLKARTKRWLRKWIENRSLKRAQKVVVLSEYSREQAIARGVRPDRVQLIPGGSDVHRFRPAGSTRLAREKLGLPNGSPLLVTIRRLVPRMGLAALVRAMPEVLESCPGAHLIIGGRGPEQATLEKLVRELRLDRAVTLAGFLPDEQLADYYSAADLFVLPTASLEGFGLVTVDALACGTPVLGTPVGAISEVLAPLDTRLLTAGTEPQDLAEGILDFWKGTWRFALGPERLHSYVRNRFTWDRHVAAMMAVYDDVLSSGSRPIDTGAR